MINETEFYIKFCRKENKTTFNPFDQGVKAKESQKCGCNCEFEHFTGAISITRLCNQHKEEFKKYNKELERKFVIVNPQGYYLKQTNPNIFTRFKDNAWVVNIEVANELKLTNELSNCIILEEDE